MLLAGNVDNLPWAKQNTKPRYFHAARWAVAIMRKSEKKTALMVDSPFARAALIGFGGLNVGLAFVGVILPGLPTTPFLLVAVWAFARSSRRFHDWLYDHPKFGPTLRAWRDHRVVSVRAKALAVLTMTLSLFYVVFFVAENWLLPTVMASIMLPTAAWLVTRASRVQAQDASVPVEAER